LGFAGMGEVGAGRGGMGRGEVGGWEEGGARRTQLGPVSSDVATSKPGQQGGSERLLGRQPHRCVVQPVQ